MSYQRQKSNLTASTVWATAIVVLGFMAMIAFLVNAGRAAELQRIMLFVGQGFIALVNIWIVYRSTRTTNTKVDRVADQVEEVKQTVNGNTPEPGSIPPAR